MTKTLFLIPALFAAFLTQAQSTSVDDVPKTEKVFYAEFGGPNVLFGANFDWRFKKNTRTGLGARIGLGFTINDKEEYDPVNGYYNYKTQSIATIPFGLNYVFGKPKSASMFEVGAGATFLTKKASVYAYDNYKEGNWIGHASFMYRYVPVDGGFTWRVGFTPIINTDGQIFPSGAIGLGYAFR